VRLRLGDLLARIGHHQAAQAVYVEALQLASAQERERALDLEQELARLSRMEIAEARLRLARLMQECDRQNEAIEHLVEITQLQVDDGAMLCEVAQALHSLECTQEAKDVWQKVLTLNDIQAAERAHQGLADTR
jgi:hypothetical protein